MNDAHLWMLGFLTGTWWCLVQKERSLHKLESVRWGLAAVACTLPLIALIVFGK